MFWRMSLREMQKRPARTFLTLLSVTLGSAAVVAVTLTTATVRNAQSAMFSALTGKTDLVITAEGGAGFEAELLEKVRQVQGVKYAAPSVNRSTIMYAGDRKAKTQILGVDPTVEEFFRSYKVTQGEAPKSGSQLALDDRFAKSMDIQVGDTVKLLSRSGMGEWKVSGLIHHQGGAALAQGGILYAPLKTVQTQFRARNRVDKIEVLVEEVQARDKVHQLVASVLPTGMHVKVPAEDNQLANESIVAAELGLMLATTFALLIAIFIIFNTFQMVVGERRRPLGIMRAIGATRKQIRRFILNEALLMGVIGTIIGSLLGILGAVLLTQATAQVLQSDMPPPQLTVGPFAISAIFGIGIAWMGAFLPAANASRLSPLEAMKPVLSREMDSRSRWLPMFGIAVFLGGGLFHLGCMWGWLSTKWTIPGSIMFLLGFVFLLPFLVEPASRIVQWILSPFVGVEAKLAHRQLQRHRSRTAMTTSVLFIAISSLLGLGFTILDNVRAVDLWCSRALVGDFFVRAAMPDMATGRSADLPDEVGETLRKLPGIRKLDPLRFVSARSGENSVILVIRGFKDSDQVDVDLVAGEKGALLKGLQQGEIAIGSVLSERLKIGLGEKLPLETLEGPKEFVVAGVVNDYIAGGLTVYMDRTLAEQVFHVEGQDAYIILADKGKLSEVEQAVTRICQEQGLLFQSNADLVEMVRSMSRGVNGGLWGLLLLGSAIASFGLINTLSMNIIEQTREIGLLRIVAMTRRQIRRMIFAQALLLGIVGFVPGALMGLVVAYLINLSTYTATGHAIEFVVRPGLLAGSVVVAMLMALIASWIPAERAAGIRLGEALGYE